MSRLSIPKKTIKTSIFDESSDEEVIPSLSLAQTTLSYKIQPQTTLPYKIQPAEDESALQVLSNDPHAFDYDNVYDSMKMQEKERKGIKNGLNPSASASERKKVNAYKSLPFLTFTSLNISTRLLKQPRIVK